MTNKHNTRKFKFVYEHIYDKLLKLIPELLTLKPGDAIKSKTSSGAFMDLNLDILDKNDEKMHIALSHYYKHPSGDMIPDPDMVIRIFFKSDFAEALTYQDSFGFQNVYTNDGRFYPRRKKDLNKFLNAWLRNCTSQGHKLVKSS